MAITTLANDADLTTTVTKVNEVIAAVNTHTTDLATVKGKVDALQYVEGAQPEAPENPAVPEGTFTVETVDYVFLVAYFTFHGKTYKSADILADFIADDATAIAVLTALVAAHYNSDEDFSEGIIGIN